LLPSNHMFSMPVISAHSAGRVPAQQQMQQTPVCISCKPCHYSTQCQALQIGAHC
jgi:hypothetical protein